MSVDKKDDSKEKPRTTTKAPAPELPNQESQVEHGMRIPFHQSKYVEDLTQPAHQLQQNQENFQINSHLICLDKKQPPVL